MNTKICTNCGLAKLLSAFSNQKSQRDGKKHQCKECDREYKKQYYTENRENILEYQKQYSEKHPEVGRRSNQKYYDLHREDINRKARKREESNPELRKRSRRKLKNENPVHVLFMQTKSRAKQSGIPFDIKETDLSVPEICPVLGIPLHWDIGRRSPNTPSIDRLVPHLGYTKDNIAVISWRANRLKNDGTSSELRTIADWMDSKTQQLPVAEDFC